MKRQFLGFTVAYILGAGTVLLVQPNALRTLVTEVPRSTSATTETAIAQLTLPAQNVECDAENRSRIFPNPVVGYENDAIDSSFTRDYRGITLKPSNEASLNRLGVLERVSATQSSAYFAEEPEPSELRITVPQPQPLEKEPDSTR